MSCLRRSKVETVKFKALVQEMEGVVVTKLVDNIGMERQYQIRTQADREQMGRDNIHRGKDTYIVGVFSYYCWVKWDQKEAPRIRGQWGNLKKLKLNKIQKPV